MKNKLRRALLERSMTVGAWVQIGHPACAEVFARAGFDWVCVDLEHGAIGIETMATVFSALDAFDCVPVARLPANDPVWIHRTLDAGARGLIIPMVNTADQARDAARECKYPPEGARGFGYSRANRYGVDFADYVAEANDEVALIVQVEHKLAIENVDQILQVEGVDAAFIGPYDLSGSLGIVGQLDAPAMKECLARFMGTCRQHGKAGGIHIVHPDEQSVRRAVDDGYTLIALASDSVLLNSGAVSALKLCKICSP